MNAVENKVTSVETKILKMGESLKKKVRENSEEALGNVNKEIEDLKEQMSNGHEKPKRAFIPSLATIKLLTFDGKTSWQVYKTQFTMVAEANRWNSRGKDFHLAASLRRDSAHSLEILPEEQRHDFQALSGAIELRIRANCTNEYSQMQLKSCYQNAGESRQELAADIQRYSHPSFSDCPDETRQDLALQHFIDGVRDPETQKALRLAYVKNIGSDLVYAHNIEAAQQATYKDWHSIRAVSGIDSDFIKQIEDLRRKFYSLEERKGNRTCKMQCWTCGADNNLPPQQGKQIYDQLAGWRCPESQKSNFKVFHISSISGDDNGLFVMGHVKKVPCERVIDTGANVTIIRTDLAHNLGEKLIWTPPCITLQTVTGDRINFHGKVYRNIAFGDAWYHHAAWVADINNQFIIGLNFLKESNFKFGYKNNESCRYCSRVEKKFFITPWVWCRCR
ncbi:gag-Pol polyprotein [Nephila pilipes]|uniref:Gag-Pol polyprotein n=1 Tax=Nephila pilipes TaxID=299642 RepID=A0A8X6MB49_NEPPI|nr:gag-Pol polyprotein [Nephila pilipes]